MALKQEERDKIADLYQRALGVVSLAETLIREEKILREDGYCPRAITIKRIWAERELEPIKFRKALLSLVNENAEKYSKDILNIIREKIPYYLITEVNLERIMRDNHIKVKRTPEKYLSAFTVGYKVGKKPKAKYNFSTIPEAI